MENVVDDDKQQQQQQQQQQISAGTSDASSSNCDWEIGTNESSGGELVNAAQSSDCSGQSQSSPKSKKDTSQSHHSSTDDDAFMDATARMQPASSSGHISSSSDCKDSSEVFNTPVSSCTNVSPAAIRQAVEQQQEQEVEVTVRKPRVSIESHTTISPRPAQQQQLKVTARKGSSMAARSRTSAPQGVYGGEGTNYPGTLLKRQLASFPVVVPLGVEPRPSGGSPAEQQEQLESLLFRWETVEQLGSCCVCGNGHEAGGGFLGYPVCSCACLHAECALLLACTSAPDVPVCPSCCHSISIVPADHAKDAGSPLREPWFASVMGLCLLAMVWLLACVLLLLLCLVEPSRREILAATSCQLLIICFVLPALLLLACFLIGWLLDKYTAKAWEVHRRRLQVAYCESAMGSDCERVLAASLMACTFLEYRATSYPFPKGANSYLNYFFLLHPRNL